MLITLGASLKVQARTNLFSHLVALPASYFETRHVGDVLSRFGSQETILQALTTDLVVAILDGVMCAVTLVMMFLLAPALATVVLVGAALYGLLRWASYAPLRQASAEAIVWAARRDSHFLETPARHQDDQALQRPARPAGALAEPARRDRQPPARHRAAAPAVPHRQRAAARRARHRRRLARRAHDHGQHLLGRPADRLHRLQGRCSCGGSAT